MVNRKSSHLARKSKNGKYLSQQLYSNIKLCEGDHVYGNLDLLGPIQVAGKICRKCTHIIYKDEVVRRREALKEIVSTAKNHIDLFQF